MIPRGFYLSLYPIAPFVAPSSKLLQLFFHTVQTHSVAKLCLRVMTDIVLCNPSFLKKISYIEKTWTVIYHSGMSHGKSKKSFELCNAEILSDLKGLKGFACRGLGVTWSWHKVETKRAILQLHVL